jgi:hypothetical protein
MCRRRSSPNSAKNFIYEIPRYGTTVEVFSTTSPEPEFPDLIEKDKKIYNLIWKDGKFTKQK